MYCVCFDYCDINFILCPLSLCSFHVDRLNLLSTIEQSKQICLNVKFSSINLVIYYKKFDYPFQIHYKKL